MNKLFKILFAVATVALMAFSAHKYYMSITQVNYSDKDKSIQITLRIFIDDIETTLNTRYGIDSKLDTKAELKNVNEYVEKYLRSRFNVSVNGTQAKYTFLGKEYDTDVMKCYIEIPSVEKNHLKNIEITNNLLFEMFPEQQNLVHFKINGKLESYILTQGNNKAMLKL